MAVTVDCPACGAPGPDDARFCEACGFDLVSGTPQAAAVDVERWEAAIDADRELFDELAPDGLAFPAAAPRRTVALDAAEVQIGRRNPARGIEPGVDLSLPPADPAVSHAHALLVRQENGSYALVDLGSANGTTVNDMAEPIAANVPVPLADGDRIHVGAWTTITIRAVRRPTR
jgi:hypothetical protein